MKTQLVALASAAMVGVVAQHVEAAATVSGTVLKQGSDASGVSVTLVGGLDGDVIFNTTSGAGGAYSFAGVADGQYTLYASGVFDGVTWSGQSFIFVFFGIPVQQNISLAPQL